MDWRRRLGELEEQLGRFGHINPECIRAEWMIGLGKGSAQDWEIVAGDELEQTRRGRLRDAIRRRAIRFFGKRELAETVTVRDYWEAAAEITSYLPDEAVPQRWLDIIQDGLDDARLIVRNTATRILAEQGSVNGISMRRRFAHSLGEWLTEAPPDYPLYFRQLHDHLLSSGYVASDYH